MAASSGRGRALGVLALLHLVTGLTLPYILLQSLTAPPAGFLQNAAGIASQVRFSVSLLFVGGAATMAIAVLAWPVLRPRAPAMGLWLLGLAVTNLSLQFVENQHYLTLLSLSLANAQAAPPDGGIPLSLAAAARTSWKWAHFTHLLVVVSWMALVFCTLYRLAMVPRALAAIALVTALMQIGGITLPVLLDYRVPFRMELYGMPLGAAYLALALWLIAKGLRTEVSGGPEALSP